MKTLPLAGLCALAALLLSASTRPFVTSAQADLNGDGKVESIALEINEEAGTFLLSVGAVSVKAELPQVDGFQVVDIATTDRYREIAVHTAGPSDDDQYKIYWFDGTRLQQVAHLARWPQFKGNGIVLVDDWMGFWSKREKYTLDKAHMLQRTPQDSHYVGVKGTVRQTFPLVQTPGAKSVVARLAEGSEVELLAAKVGAGSLEGDWYLIKSSTKLLGWARGAEVFGKLDGLPMAD